MPLDLKVKGLKRACRMPSESLIHPTALVAQDAVVGLGTRVGPFCRIGSGVVLGEGCVLESQALVEGPAVYGDRNHFRSSCYVGAAPQDMKYHGEETRLEVGDDNVFYEGATIHRGTAQGGAVTRIGSGNTFGPWVHVAHDCLIGDHNVLGAGTGLSGHVVLDDHIHLDEHTGSAQFVHVASYAYAAPGSMLDAYLPPFVRGSGNRFLVEGTNLEGMRHFGFSREVCDAVVECHRLYFFSGMDRLQALHSIESLLGDVPEVAAFVKFARNAREQRKGIAHSRDARND